ncbi:MAG TPA: TMEM175 family protein [Gemmatimonadales bacterium]|nr:TMEM175 family protein [Gemmatimonadales bacterium]
MSKSRMEAFSDGVIAIIITIMVLEMRPPHGADLASLRPLLPVFLSYVLSYVYVGIYWNNHHHLLHACRQISGRVLWANLLLLFWLSLFPFCTGWMGENHFAALPTAVYGVVLLAAAYAFVMLQAAIVAADGPDSRVARAVGTDRKALVSRLLYVVGIAGAFWRPWIGWACYVAVALIWFIPDRRIERVLARDEAAARPSP